MQHDEFVGLVQQRARLDSRGAAQQAIKATLETLAERLAGGAPGNIAAQLPQPIRDHLEREGGAEQFGVDEFYRRVAERESAGTGEPQAVFHAKAVLSVVGEATQGNVFEDVIDQLPDEFADLLDYEGAVS